MLKLFSKVIRCFLLFICKFIESKNKSNKLLHLTQRSTFLFVLSLRSFLHKNPLQPLRK